MKRGWSSPSHLHGVRGALVLLPGLLRQRDPPVLGQGPRGVGGLRAVVAQVGSAGGAVEHGGVGLVLVAEEAAATAGGGAGVAGRGRGLGGGSRRAGVAAVGQDPLQQLDQGEVLLQIPDAVRTCSKNPTNIASAHFSDGLS